MFTVCTSPFEIKAGICVQLVSFLPVTHVAKRYEHEHEREVCQPEVLRPSSQNEHESQKTRHPHGVPSRIAQQCPIFPQLDVDGGRNRLAYTTVIESVTDSQSTGCLRSHGEKIRSACELSLHHERR